MSDFFKNDKTHETENLSADETSVTEAEVEGQDFAESTVFSAPQEHNDRKKQNSGKRVIMLLAVVLAAILIFTCTVATILFIPKKADDDTSSTDSIFSEITVLDKESSNFTNVEITNSNGTFNFTTKDITVTDDDGETTTTTYWSVENIDISKLSNTTMKSIVDSTASVTAIQEITSKSASECGFDTPKIKVTVTESDGSTYTVLIGEESPDGLGSYLKLDGEDKIYLAEDSAFSSFEFSLLDLADKTSIPATTFNSDTSENKSDDGAYAYFDTLKISGKLFPENLTIINNTGETDSDALIPYIITEPAKRYVNSENLTPFVYLFSQEIAVTGAYAWEINDQTLAEFGLDKPDAQVSMTIDGETKTFKISKIDDDYCAVVYDGAKLIRKVLSSSIGFMEYTTEDLYYKNLFMNSINDITALTLKDVNGEVKFDISYTEDSENNKTYNIEVDGKKITTTYFQKFYADFVGIQSSSFALSNVSDTVDATVTFTYYDNSNMVIDFYKANATEYQYSIDGVPSGKITSSAFNKMIKNIRLTAENNKIN